METKSLNNVEIFSVGIWKGMTFSRADLDDIVDNTNDVFDELMPYAKLDHDRDQWLIRNSGLPAAGWLTNIRRVDDKILADIDRVPALVADIIDMGGYRRVSIELWMEFVSAITEKRYNMVMPALAFLGAETPAVRNLEDLADWYKKQENFSEGGADGWSLHRPLITHFQSNEGKPEMAKDNETLTMAEVEAKIAEAVQSVTTSVTEKLQSEFSEKEKAYKAQHEADQARIAALEEAETKRQEITRKKVIDTFAETMVSAGALLPAEISLVKTFLDSVSSQRFDVTFAEGDETKELNALEAGMHVLNTLLTHKKRKVVEMSETAQRQFSESEIADAEVRSIMNNVGVPVKPVNV